MSAMENRAWERCGSLNILPSSFSFQGVLESGVVPASLHSFHRSPKPRCLGVRRRPFPAPIVTNLLLTLNRQDAKKPGRLVRAKLP